MPAPVNHSDNSYGGATSQRHSPAGWAGHDMLDSSSRNCETLSGPGCDHIGDATVVETPVTLANTPGCPAAPAPGCLGRRDVGGAVPDHQRRLRPNTQVAQCSSIVSGWGFGLVTSSKPTTMWKRSKISNSRISCSAPTCRPSTWKERRLAVTMPSFV